MNIIKTNKKLPLVSIITGYYNRQDQVSESIKSLINQSYQNTEIIIFDDCSTDDTYNRLNEFAVLDSRIQLIKHEKNIGFVQGLIEAINVSKGEFIAIHGSGDLSYENRIEKQVACLLKMTSVSVVGCHFYNSRKGKVIDTIKHTNELGFKKKLLKRNVFSHGEVMFRKSTYDKVGGYRPFFQYSQDYDLWCRMSLISDYYIIQEVLYTRNNDSDNAVSNSTLKLVRQAVLEVFIRQCIELRNKQGYDYIDIAGDQALAFRKKSLKLSVKIAYKYLLGENLLAPSDDLDKVWLLVKSDKFSFAKFFIFLIRARMINSRLTFELIRFLINTVQKY